MITSPQDDLTAEREKVKGLREWAERKAKAGVQFISVLTDGEVHGLVAKLLQAEHARAVRIVKRKLVERERMLANAAQPSFNYDWAEPQVVVLRQILDDLMKGRA